jgi:hypothetical protein
MNCQIEYVSSDSDGMPCGKTAVAKCSDCGSAICSDCQSECCGDSFCGQCYDYHVANSCVKKPVQNESHPLSTTDAQGTANAGNSFRNESVVCADFRNQRDSFRMHIISRCEIGLTHGECESMEVTIRCRAHRASYISFSESSS